MPGDPPLSDVVRATTATLTGGGEDRPGQLAMAEAVERAIAAGRHLVVQAGTGTGKSLAYLIPAIRSGRTVVISTATRALQDQLATNDLPQLSRAFGGSHPVRFAVLKGRSNYLCRQRAAEIAGRPAWRTVRSSGSEQPGAAEADAGPPPTVGPGRSDGMGDRRVAANDSDPAVVTETPLFTMHEEPPTARIADEVRQLLQWAETSASGDRGELPFEPSPRAWAMVAVGPRECPGAFRCPSGDDCFAEQARAAAAAAQVVVVNTSLYTAHLASDNAVLPEHDVVVFDEAHELQEIVSQGLGVEITAGRLRSTASTARGVLAGSFPATDDPAAALATAADQLQQVLDRSEGRRLHLERHPEMADLLTLIRGRAEALARALRSAGERLVGADPAGGGDGARRIRAQLSVGNLLDDLDTVLTDHDDQVIWVAAGGNGRTASLRSAPVDVAPILARRLWCETTAVLTSATIPPGVVAQLGLPARTTDCIDVGSPFPYRELAMLYVATSLPDRRQPEADAAAHGELAELILAAGGRTLALFTSWRAMTAAATALRPMVPFPILAQGDLPKAQLVARFTADEATCLFATMSFWQGVDVPGRGASLVVIDRLPFPRPDEPLLQARRERAGANAFAAVDLPRAATLLAQGAGRLVRRATDTGVVAVLDRRLATAGYRRTLLATVPPMRRTVRRDEVLDFLRGIARSAGDAEAPASPEAQ